MMRTCSILACLCTLVSCGDPNATPADGGLPDTGPADPTYEAVEAILMASCSSSVCHGGTGAGAARLNFSAELAAGRPLTSVLVGQAACQYDLMPRVDPGRPDNSWLMIKLEGPHTGRVIDFTPSPEWDPGISPNEMGLYPASTCPRTRNGEISFGRLMPLSSTSGLAPSRIALIRAWILAGAPGPSSR